MNNKIEKNQNEFDYNQNIIFSYKVVLNELIHVDFNENVDKREWTIELVVRRDGDRCYYTECYWDNKEIGDMLFSIPTLHVPLEEPFGTIMNELNLQMMRVGYKKLHSNVLYRIENVWVNKGDIYNIFNALIRSAERYAKMRDKEYDNQSGFITDYYE